MKKSKTSRIKIVDLKYFTKRHLKDKELKMLKGGSRQDFIVEDEVTGF